MSAQPYAVSESLLRNLAKPIRNEAVFQAALDGSLLTRPAQKGPHPGLNRQARRLSQRFERKWQRSPDRAASVRRRRQLGGSSSMPDTIRHHYTEGQRAALAVVSGEVKHHGVCDLPIDRIAAVAGVSRTTVQNALREARALGHIFVEARPRPGQKNLTNLVRIVSGEWMGWLKRGPSLTRSIGFKTIHPTKNQDHSSSTASNCASGRHDLAGDGWSARQHRGQHASLEQEGRSDGGLKQTLCVSGPSLPSTLAGGGRPGISRAGVKLKDKGYLARG